MPRSHQGYIRRQKESAHRQPGRQALEPGTSQQETEHDPNHRARHANPERARLYRLREHFAQAREGSGPERRRGGSSSSTTPPKRKVQHAQPSAAPRRRTPTGQSHRRQRSRRAASVAGRSWRREQRSEPERHSGRWTGDDGVRRSQRRAPDGGRRRHPQVPRRRRDPRDGSVAAVQRARGHPGQRGPGRQRQRAIRRGAGSARRRHVAVHPRQHRGRAQSLHVHQRLPGIEGRRARQPGSRSARCRAAKRPARSRSDGSPT